MSHVPTRLPPLAPDDLVQVVMTEQHARLFEERCLGKPNTRGETRLSPPLAFGEDDLPTYIIVVEPWEPE